LQLKFSSRELDIKFSRIFPWKKLLCTALINIAFGFVFYFIKRFIPLDKAVGSIAESIILGIVWGVCYILITKANILKNWHRLNESEN
jgi:EamA domain-containing membrane protein RarD